MAAFLGPLARRRLGPSRGQRAAGSSHPSAQRLGSFRNVSRTRSSLAGVAATQVEVGSHVSVLLHASFSVTVPATYFTFFPLGGSRVISVTFLSVSDSKTRIGTPGVPGSAWSGCGPLKCSDRLNGGIAETLLETGVFFSVDPRTQLLAAEPKQTDRNGVVYSVWDYEQLRAFGLNHFGNAPLLKLPGWIGSEYAGTASPVAGPDAFYTNDNRGTVLDISQKGPWRRVASPGSRAAKNPPVRPVMPYKIDEGEIVSAADWTEETLSGIALSEKHPLPNETTAVRMAAGKANAGQSVYVVVDVEVTNVTAFSAAVRSRKARDVPCAIVNGVENGTGSGAATANMWRSYLASPLYCDAVEELLPLETAKWSITALPIAAKCDGSADGSIYLATNGAVAPFVYEWSDGLVSSSPQRKDVKSGNYRVTIVDANGDSNYEDVVVGIEHKPMKPKVLARGKGEGTIALRVALEGGRPPFQCKWNKTQLRECNVTSTAASNGDDFVTITDGNGCVATANLTAASFVQPLVFKLVVQMREAVCESVRFVSRVSVKAKGGAAPYSYQWVIGDGTVVLGEEITNVKPSDITLTLTDSFGSKFVRIFRVGRDQSVVWVEGVTQKIVVSQEVLVPFALELTLLNHVPCFGQKTGRFQVNMKGGVAPYSFYPVSQTAGGVDRVVGDVVFSGGGLVRVVATDAAGCKAESEIEVLPALPFQVIASWKETHSAGWRYYNITADFINGVPPFSITWNHIRSAELSHLPLELFPAGKYTLTAVDHMLCVSPVELILPEKFPEICPSLAGCMNKISGHTSYFIGCLRRVASPLLWDPSKWNLCQARAAFELVKVLHVPYNQIGIQSIDNGAVFIANLLGQALRKCEENRGAAACNFPWSLLRPYFAEFPLAEAAFDGRDFAECFRFLTLLENTNATDVVTVAPFGYDNDPVFAPQLALPGGLSVIALVVHHVRFPSSVVRTAIYPWTLQADVELGALFLKHFLQLVTPRFVVPSDNAGILLLHKLGSMASAGDPSLDSLVPLFQRSLKWPIEYPPASISKLIPGHEAFAPREIVVSECDGLHCIAMEDARLQEAFASLGPNTYLKREYSEASRGVAHISKAQDISRAAATVFARQDGIGSMDRELNVRIFLQQAVSGKGQPVGARFFAVQGRVLAMALSQLEGWADGVALRYQTVRVADVEAKCVGFVSAINFTGFGSAWFWPDEGKEREWRLIDFNARIERHACLGAVLGESDSSSDPCVVFQRYLAGESFDSLTSPLIVRSSVTYLDPIRISEIMDPVWGSALNKYSEWNIQRQDALLIKRVHLLNIPNLTTNVTVSPSFTKWTDGEFEIVANGGLSPYQFSVRNVRASLATVFSASVGTFKGLVPGRYHVTLKDTRNVEAETTVLLGDESVYKQCKWLNACFSHLMFQDAESFAHCLAPNLASAFASKPTWDECVVRGLISLLQSPVLDEGGVARAYVQLVLDRLMHFNNRGLYSGHAFNETLNFKLQFLHLLDLLAKDERRRGAILGFGLTNDARNTQSFVFIPPATTGGVNVMLSPARPVGSSRVLWIPMPAELTRDLSLASYFLEDLKRVLDVTDVVPTDELAYFVVSGGKVKHRFEDAKRVRLVSESDGFHNVSFDLSRVEKAWNELGRDNVVLRREFSAVDDAIALPGGESFALDSAHSKMLSIAKRSGGVGVLDLRAPIRIYAEKIVAADRVARKTFYFFARSGRIVSGHLLRHTAGGKLTTLGTSSFAIVARTVAFIKSFSFSGFGSCEWWGPDSTAHMVQFRPFLSRHHCLSRAISNDTTADPCSALVPGQKFGSEMAAAAAGVEFYTASARNAARFAFDSNVRLNVPAHDAGFVDSLADRVAQIIRRRLTPQTTRSSQ